MRSLTGVPEQLDRYTDSPPLSSGDAPHVVVPHPGVGALPKPQLGYDVIHLPQNKQTRLKRTCFTTHRKGWSL